MVTLSSQSCRKSNPIMDYICKMTLKVLARFYKNQENLFTFNLKYLSLVGLWPPEDLSPTKRILYKIYETAASILSLIFLVISGIGMYQSKNDITIFLANLDKSLALYNFSLKAVVFIIKRNKMRNLIKQIEESGDQMSEDRKALIVKYVVFITVLSLSIIAAFMILAFFEGGLGVDVWMPFDQYKNTMNLLIASQILAVPIVMCCLRSFAMKGIVCSLIMYMCDQLVELQNYIKMLQYSEELEQQMRKKFKKIVKKHIRLMSYSKSMEEIFKEYFLIQNLTVSVELCLNAVMMTIAGVKQISLLITFLAYLFGALLNAYIYCYLGNELMLKSEGIALAAYESTWISWPIDMQKDLLLIIMAAQKPFKLSAGGITLICIQTFSQTLYNGYSIFAVLNDIVN